MAAIVSVELVEQLSSDLLKTMQNAKQGMDEAKDWGLNNRREVLRGIMIASGSFYKQVRQIIECRRDD